MLSDTNSSFCDFQVYRAIETKETEKKKHASVLFSVSEKLSEEPWTKQNWKLSSMRSSLHQLNIFMPNSLKTQRFIKQCKLSSSLKMVSWGSNFHTGYDVLALTSLRHPCGRSTLHIWVAAENMARRWPSLLWFWCFPHPQCFFRTQPHAPLSLQPYYHT